MVILLYIWQQKVRLGQLLHEQALLCTSVCNDSTFSSAQHRHKCRHQLSHCHWTFFFSRCFNIFSQLLEKPERSVPLVLIKTWTYISDLNRICFAKAIPLKIGSKFFSEKINAKKTQPCVSGDAKARAHVSTSVNKKKQTLLSDYINHHISATSAVIFYVVNWH